MRAEATTRIIALRTQCESHWSATELLIHLMRVFYEESGKGRIPIQLLRTVAATTANPAAALGQGDIEPLPFDHGDWLRLDQSIRLVAGTFGNHPGAGLRRLVRIAPALVHAKEGLHRQAAIVGFAKQQRAVIGLGFHFAHEVEHALPGQILRLIAEEMKIDCQPDDHRRYGGDARTQQYLPAPAIDRS